MPMPKPQSTQQNYQERLKEWLQTQGYPLEFRAASLFSGAGFDVTQSAYLTHANGNAREVDLVASISRRPENALIRGFYVAECKNAEGKPWVVFSHRRHLASSACIAQTISNRAGHAALDLVRDRANLCELDSFHPREHTGFAGRQAFSGNADRFYEAVQSVTSAAVALMNAFETRQFEELFSLVAFVFPVVVVGGDLFSAYLDEATGSVELEEADSVRLHWRGNSAWPLHATVDVVTERALSKFVRRRQGDALLLVDELQRVLAAIEEAKRSSRLSPIEEVTRADVPSIVRDYAFGNEDSTKNNVLSVCTCCDGWGQLRP